MAVNNLNTPGVGIQPSLIDAKGDLLVGTANDAIDRLGVTGTTGAVLTADAGETTGLKWAAAGSVGGLVHIETVSFTTVSSFQFTDGIITSDYEIHKVYLNLTAFSTNNLTINMNFRNAGSDITGTNFYRHTKLIAAGSSISGAGALNSNSFPVADISSAAANVPTLSEIVIPNAALALQKFMFTRNSSRDAGGTVVLFQYGQNFNSTTAIDNLKCTTSTGTMTGSASIYGVKK
jgi:hypothetical protein